MEFCKKSTLIMAAIGLMLFACSPDAVKPGEDGNDSATLAGAVGDPHPKMDTTCQFSDTLFLANEATGSIKVDRCFGAPYPGGPVSQITCPPNQMNWGYLVMAEGYEGDTNMISCDFAMAPGWYCDFNNWQFGVAGSFLMGANGVPIVGTDWSSRQVNPVQNKWQLRLRVNQLPTPSFDVALRVSAVRLNLFGAVTPGSNTVLWGKNRNWCTAGSCAATTSPWLMHFTPSHCLSPTPPPAILTSCMAHYMGISELSNCNLTANTSGLTGTLTYLWSTGATTQNASVVPTANTTYSVTISSNGTAVRINQISVNVANIKCGNGNNPNHKVWVCHYPPGNPNNPQEICIDWSGVPAHVAAYRAPGSNPNQGHDSGCKIGRCGVNLCQ